MKTKVCNKCSEKKPISEFYRDLSSLDKLQYRCKDCCKIYSIDYRHSKEGIVNKIYNHQIETSKQRKHQLPSYTKDELQEWLFNQPNFDKLYNNWVESGYDKWLKPSTDRKDDYKSYTIDNIQLMTWKENFNKGHNDRKNGINNKQSKAVLQFNINGKLINRYHSMKYAGRVTGFEVKSIRRTCKGERKTAYGFVWRYE